MIANKPTSLLEARNLSKSLGGALLFEHLELRVDSAQSLAILGESGSGKSSLLHLMAGLDHADSGTVLWSGQALDTLSAEQLADLRLRHVGLVFQAFYLMPHLTALQNIQLPYLLAGQKPNTERCRALLASVGLLDKATRFPRELSGGEQQRVAIARALALAPPLILADEPTGNLDERNAEAVLQVLLQLCEHEGCALVMVTHSDKVAAQMGSRFELAHQSLQALV